MTTRFTPDGFYRTGDKAQITPEGNLRILGRVREQINRCGEKIMPSEVESELMKIPAVIRCAVVGIPDTLLGSAVCALIEAEPEVTKQEVRQAFQQNGVSGHLFPDYVFPVKQWPVTTVKKLDRDKLTALAVQMVKGSQGFHLHEIPMSYLISRDAQGELAGVSCHAYVEFAVAPLDPVRLEKAWKKLFALHPVMRCSVRQDGTAVEEADRDDGTVMAIDLSSLSEDEAENEILTYRRHIVRRKLHISKGQSMSLLLLRKAETDVLMFDIDLTVCDVVSFHLLLNELGICYTAFGSHLAFPEQEDSVPEAVSDSRTEMPVRYYPEPAQLPERIPASEITRADYETHEAYLPAEIWQEICSYLSRQGMDVFSYLNACFAMCMTAHGNHNHYFKSPVFPRQKQGSIGDFTRLLFVRFRQPDAENQMQAFRMMYDEIHAQITADRNALPQSDLAEMRKFPAPEPFRGDIVFSTTPEVSLLESAFDGHLPALRFVTSQTPRVALDMQVYRYRGGLYVNTVAPCGLFENELIEQIMSEFCTALKTFGGIVS